MCLTLRVCLLLLVKQNAIGLTTQATYWNWLTTQCPKQPTEMPVIGPCLPIQASAGFSGKGASWLVYDALLLFSACTSWRSARWVTDWWLQVRAKDLLKNRNACAQQLALPVPGILQLFSTPCSTTAVLTSQRMSIVKQRKMAQLFNLPKLKRD